MKKFCVKQTMAVVCACGLILAVNGRLFAADIDSADVLPEREAEIEASADADEAEAAAETDVDAEAEWMPEINEAAEAEDTWTDDAVDAVSRATVAFKKLHFQGHVIKGTLHTTGSGWAYATTKCDDDDPKVEVQVSITSPHGHAASGWYSTNVTAGNVQGTSGLHGQHQARIETAYRFFETYH